MKFSEAMKALEEGERVRVKRWDKGEYISQEANIEESWPITKGETTDEWELFHWPTEKIDFQQVVKGLREGKRFRRPIWNEVSFISQRGGAICDEHADVGNFLLIEDYEATDWIEVEE